ncbi:MAG TPA: preprotein translocase subunit SecG [Ignavibacteria bacterium]|nr:preprotein translocase subunit SecG [Ignavibacteria bacterium]
MISILIFLLVVVAIMLMGVVLIQSSKGGGLAGTFGGGDATAVFGVRRTADFLIKVTTTLATILLLFSLITNVIINKNIGTTSSFIQDQQQTLPQPNTPDQLQQPQQQTDPNQQQTDPNQQPNNQPQK